MTTTYAELLAGKAQVAEETGFPQVSADDVNPMLYPHQRDAVMWSVRGGRRAVFASFGLGKTVMQLETLRLTAAHVGPEARTLITCPLGVRQEFARDARMLGGPAPRFVRRTSEIDEPGLYMTNYESIREGKLDPTGFDAVSLDEAAILRGFGGTKTFRELMKLYEGSSAYRFVATATPSPNDYIELLSYAAFLDILDVGQAKTRFFKRDSEHADRLTLLPHMEHEFWMWVASWALFIGKPSDLGYSDEGYELPALDIVWHQVPAGVIDEPRVDRDGQPELFRDASLGVQSAAAEKRASIPTRIDKLREIIAAAPADEHFVIWHDQEAERHAIQKALPDAVSVWGAQDLDEREDRIVGFEEGDFRILSTKPVIAGSGTNFQRHCHRAVFAGIGFKFADFIQAIHRIHRFGQTRPVRIDLIYTGAEAGIRTRLERKWRNHERLVTRMIDIVREHGITSEAIRGGLRRTGVPDRQEFVAEARGLTAQCILNDSVLEVSTMPDDSVGQIVTSIPFSTQYEYSPSVNDFGHNADNNAFWAQMDYLTTELYRVLQPGRVACIHVKDRIVPGGINGLGFRTLHPFHVEALEHYQRHGFAFLGMITVVTDVVRENNQTYRLSWSEQVKDGSSMGVGVPEYVLILRKPQTDRAKGYADDRIAKSKDDYTLGRWQVDAHGFWRSNGNRHLLPEEFAGLTHAEMFRLFRDHNLANRHPRRPPPRRRPAPRRLHAAATPVVAPRGVDRHHPHANPQHGPSRQGQGAAPVPAPVRHRRPAHRPLVQPRRRDPRPVRRHHDRPLLRIETRPVRDRRRTQPRLLARRRRPRRRRRQRDRLTHPVRHPRRGSLMTERRPSQPVTLDLDQLEHTAQAASAIAPGRWGWHGDTSGPYRNIELGTWIQGLGRCTVMRPVRYGMQGAQPAFLGADILIHKAHDLVRYQVGRQDLIGEAARQDPGLYRTNVAGIDHPIAEHIAAASPDTILALIAMIRDLQRTVQQLALDALDEAITHG